MPGTPVRRLREVSPREAAQIASQLRAAAQLISDQLPALRHVGTTLDLSWSGEARNRFMQTFEGKPRRVEDVVALLEDHARRVESITVEVWEMVMVDDRRHVPR